MQNTPVIGIMTKCKRVLYTIQEGRYNQLASRYPSDYENRGRVEPGISRSSRPSSASRSGAPRSSASRSGGARQGYSSARPSGQRYASGQRSPQRPPQRSSGGSRRPSGNRRRQQPNRGPQVIAALAVVLLIALVLIIAKPFGRRKADPVTDGSVAPVSNPVTQVTLPPDFAELDDGEEEAAAPQYDTLQEQLSDSNYEMQALSEEEMATINDLHINTSLPSEWLNVLFLGTDERTLSASARTDAIMICSINRNTGEVKLSSIMRDLAVEFKDIGKYNGTYGINAANYFGGANLAMRTVNEKFNMNCQYYVMVNFFGFGKIAQRLGGIEVDITEQEMKIINRDIVKQFKMAYRSGITDFDPERVLLESYGENVHLNGNQTLAYARIRHLDGGDYMRTTRQQTVLNKLLKKAKGLSALEVTTLATEMIGQVKTNLPLNEIANLAIQVVGNGISSDIDTFRIPVQGTYKEERRNNNSLLYDCDFATNATKLYDFIYY